MLSELDDPYLRQTQNPLRFFPTSQLALISAGDYRVLTVNHFF